MNRVVAVLISLLVCSFAFCGEPEQVQARPESSVDKALRWLAQNQEPDGHFSAKKCQTADQSDTVATSLALLAWLGASHSEKVGSYKENIKRAIAWLIAHQAADGSVADVTDTANPQVIIPPQAAAALALAEAAGMGGRTSMATAAAQKASDYCIGVHQEVTGGQRGGWGYKAKSPGDLRASVWFIMAFRSAKIAGLKADPLFYDGAIRFLDSIEHKNAAQTDSGAASIYWRTPAVEEPEQAHVLTAMGTLARQFLGAKREELQPNVEWLIAKGGVPSWEKRDPMYWYFGTLCALHQGGKLWQNWDTFKRQILEKNQNTEGAAAGAWNISWGAMTGALCLEIYQRWPRLK